MKKLLLAAILASGAIVPMAAGEFSVLYEGEPVENGSTIEFKDFKVTVQDGGEYGMYYTWKVDPELYLLVDQAGVYTVHAKSLNGESFQLCAGGNCIMGTDLVKDKVEFVLENGTGESKPLVGEPMNLQLDWAENTIDEPEIYIPALEISVEVFNNAEPTNVLSFTLKMGGFEAAGVESVGVEAGSVVLKGKSLYYDIPGSSQLSVYSLSGKTLVNQTVSGNGYVSLEGLSKGVYLYRLSGKTNKAAKFIIK